MLQYLKDEGTWIGLGNHKIYIRFLCTLQVGVQQKKNGGGAIQARMTY